MRLDRVVIYWLKKNVSPTEGKWETKLQLYLHYITLTLVLFYSLTSINKIVCHGQVFLGSGFSFIPLTLACFVCVCVCVFGKFAPLPVLFVLLLWKLFYSQL